MLTGVERSRAPFQDILCEGSDRGIIQGSNAIFEWFPVLPVTFKCDDQLGVSEHRHVGVVGTGDHLSNTRKRSGGVMREIARESTTARVGYARIGVWLAYRFDSD